MGLALLAALACPRPAPAGTVAEQRARLPPPAQCDDDLVQGIWKSHDYRSRYGEWTVFTLEIRRVGKTDALKGTIRNESWDGPADRSEPGPCRDQFHRIVSMDAEGSITDGVIAFRGVGQWRLDNHICGSSGMGYNLDDFTGPLEEARLEFQSVNNDGGRAVNEPTVFRRVSCLPEHEGAVVDERPKVYVKPPSYYAPEEQSSGGCLAR